MLFCGTANGTKDVKLSYDYDKARRYDDIKRRDRVVRMLNKRSAFKWTAISLTEKALTLATI